MSASSAGKPSVAYLTSRMPAPPLSGGQLREFNLLKRLGRSFDISLWVVTMFPQVCRTGLAEMQKHCRSVDLYTAEPANDRPGDVPLRVWQQRSSAMKSDLSVFLKSGKTDLVHVEGYYMMQYIPDGLEIPVMLVEENIEYLIDQQQELVENGSAAEPAWPLVQWLEIQQWQRASRCGAVSEDDIRHMREHAPGLDPVYVPHGFDHLRFEGPDGGSPAQPDGKSVLFVADYTYPPSHDGAMFLLAEIWPRVVAADPAARLSIVGRGITSQLQDQAALVPGITLVGYVESVRDAFNLADVFVCPLRAGGGVKLKMLEAISQGVPTVSTSVGVQGLPGKITAEMTVRDRPDAFADGILGLLADGEARKRHREALLDAALELPTWDATARILADAWQGLLPADRGGPT